MPFTSIYDLYSTICSISEAVTGRPTWSKMGIQAAPNTPYATVYITQGSSFSYDNVQYVELTPPEDPLNPTLKEVVWGATRLEVEVEFYRDTRGGNSAMTSATIFRNALLRDARNYDLWTQAGLSGDIQIIDMSAIFRADTESRFKVMFSIYANIQNDPDEIIENVIHEIDHQQLDVYKEDDLFKSTIVNRGGES